MNVINGCVYRKTHLPNSILNLKKKINCINLNINDGRIESSVLENEVLEKLSKIFKNRIKIPNIRMWYDFLIFDYLYGWLPVDIKISSCKSPDNICSIAGLVYSYTNIELDLTKHYKNGQTSKILIENLKLNNINYKPKKDYYFLVINKDSSDIIVNSIKGLVVLHPNTNNLPFQVNWSKNYKFVYKSIQKNISLFLDIYNNEKRSWKYIFINEIKSLGQYFTKNKDLQEKVKSFVKLQKDPILEPSIGRGDLVSLFPERVFDMYEIDENIEMLSCIDTKKVIFGDFLQQDITKKYHTIISNPPYVKTKTGNIYKDFIEKCYDITYENGEMIFIVASDFFKKTNCSKLLTKLLENGTFTHIYHPHNENLFDDAKVDIVIFRYLKDKNMEKICLYNDVKKYIKENSGVITFHKEIQSNICLSDILYIKVGLVSGCEEVFKNNIGNVKIITNENILSNYIMINDYPCNNKDINSHLLKNKIRLLNRKIKKFREDDWFKWGAPRNIEFMKSNKNKECIYIHNISRKENVAFLGKVDLFGANLICMMPKSNVDLQNIVNYLNSFGFKENYTYSKKFIIGQKQLMMHNI